MAGEFYYIYAKAKARKDSKRTYGFWVPHSVCLIRSPEDKQCNKTSHDVLQSLKINLPSRREIKRSWSPVFSLLKNILKMPVELLDEV